MDAVASNVAALGLPNLAKTTTPVSTVPAATVVLPGGVVATTTPATLASLPITAAVPAIIPPPGIAIPQITPDKKIQPSIVTPIVNAPQVSHLCR